MIGAILQFFNGIPYEFVTLIIASMPVVEVRLSIPIAVQLFNMQVWQAVLLSFAGASVPAIVLPLIFENLEKPCRKAFPFCDRMFDGIINHVQKRFTSRYQMLGAIGLILFVAIPLPGTGVWTGALASWIFRIKKRTAIPAILVGLAIASIIVAGATLGVFGAINLVV